MEIVLGIDIGGTSTKLGLVRADGQLFAQRTVNTGVCQNEHAFFALLFQEIEIFITTYKGNATWVGIGIGAPSCNEKAGTLERAANFPFSESVPILKLFEAHFGLPVYLLKDGNAATVGEWRYGAAQGMQNFMLITLGTGIGGGIVANGQLIKGANGWAGEFGHLTIEKGGRKCGCGRLGCLETYASATGLRLTALNMLEKEETGSSLRFIPKEVLSSKDVYHAAEAGDQVALAVFERVGAMLGTALSNLSVIFDPEAIFLAGGLAAAGDILFKPLRHSFEASLLSQLSGKISVLPSALRLNEAAILGAASLVWNNKTLITTS